MASEVSRKLHFYVIWEVQTFSTNVWLRTRVSGYSIKYIFQKFLGSKLFVTLLVRTLPMGD